MADSVTDRDGAAGPDRSVTFSEVVAEVTAVGQPGRTAVADAVSVNEPAMMSGCVTT